MAETGEAPAYSTDMEFWEWMVGAGYIDGDPIYYSSGEAAAHAGAYSHAITTAFESTEPGSDERKLLVDRLYDEGIITSADTPEGRSYWTSTTVENLGTDMENLATAAESFFVESNGAAGRTETTPGIMSGGTLIKMEREGQDPIWGMSYTVGNSTHIFTFDSQESMQAALGQDAVTSGVYGFTIINESVLDDPNAATWIMGSADALVGQDGSYQGFFDDIMREAALNAGVRNPGMLGDYLADPDVQRIIAEGVIGEWSPERVQAEIRSTPFYQDVLYPGIGTLLDKGVPDPEATWWQYHNSVSDNLAMLGYEMDADGTFRSSIGAMMDAGISDTVFNQMAPVYQRAANDTVFASTLDYWLDQTAGRDVTFDDVFDALAGQTSGDLQVAVESAIIQFQADQYSTNLSADQISRIASQTQLSEAEIARSFSTSEEALLALGNQGLERYGLSEEMLVNAAFGLETGGVNAVDVRRLANKTTKELGLVDDQKAQFYSSFNERGALVKPGLSALAPEAG